MDADIEEPNPATMNAALALTHFAWNREIQGDSITSKNYKKVLRESEKVNPSLWNELARKSSEELIDILTKRNSLRSEGKVLFEASRMRSIVSR